ARLSGDRRDNVLDTDQLLCDGPAHSPGGIRWQNNALPKHAAKSCRMGSKPALTPLIVREVKETRKRDLGMGDPGLVGLDLDGAECEDQSFVGVIGDPKGWLICPIGVTQGHWYGRGSRNWLRQKK